jgi:hypothetical protein
MFVLRYFALLCLTVLSVAVKFGIVERGLVSYITWFAPFFGLVRCFFHISLRFVVFSRNFAVAVTVDCTSPCSLKPVGRNLQSLSQRMYDSCLGTPASRRAAAVFLGCTPHACRDRPLGPVSSRLRIVVRMAPATRLTSRLATGPIPGLSGWPVRPSSTSTALATATSNMFAVAVCRASPTVSDHVRMSERALDRTQDRCFA